MSAQTINFKRRLEALRSKRLPHETHWRDCYDFTIPMRSQGFLKVGEDATAIATRQSAVMDETLAGSGRALSASIVSGICPAAMQWFDYDDGDGEDEDAASDGKRWLNNAANVVWRNIHAANFDSEIIECVSDMVTIGWGVLFIDEQDQGGYRFEWIPAAECYIASTQPGGKADILYREYSLTAEQIVTQFSMRGDVVPEKVSKCIEKNPDEMFALCHAIYPRKGASGKTNKGMAFASCHFVIETGEMIRESGYHEQPFAVARWSMLPQSCYAIGPVSVALPTARSLNKLKEMQFAALDLNIGGIWKARDDGVMNPANVKIEPRSVVSVSDMDNLQPLKDGADFNPALVTEERLQASIRKVMMTDQLQPQDGPAMTATEVHVRVQMIRQALGPLYGRIQSEFFTQIIDRCFGLIFRAGILGTPPDELRGAEVRPRYLAAIARAQRQQDIAAIEQSTMSVMQVAQASPEVLDNVDLDAAARKLYELHGASIVLRKTEDRDKIRAGRKQAQEQAQQQAMLAPVMQEAGKQMVKQ